MKKQTLLAALCLITASLSWSQAASAFDCRKAKTRAEHTVCGSASLRYLDEQLNMEYRYAKKIARSAWFKRRLITSQRRWMKTRNRCSSRRSCLHRVYTSRLADLENTYQTGN